VHALVQSIRTGNRHGGKAAGPGAAAGGHRSGGQERHVENNGRSGSVADSAAVSVVPCTTRLRLAAAAPRAICKTRSGCHQGGHATLGPVRRPGATAAARVARRRQGHPSDGPNATAPPRMQSSGGRSAMCRRGHGGRAHGGARSAAASGAAAPDAVAGEGWALPLPPPPRPPPRPPPQQPPPQPPPYQ